MSITPAWFARLPMSRGKHIVNVDNNVISNYFFETPQADVAFVFADARVQIRCGRQVIDEALNHPGLSIDVRPTIWAQLTKLQEAGKIFLSGTSQMTPPMLQLYQGLSQLLQRSGLSREDAPVVADAIVKRVPLFTIERRSRQGLDNALRNRDVGAFLRNNGMATTLDEILVG